jgi:hypothetical protein
MGRKSASGSGIRDEQPGSYFLELRNQFFWFFWVKILKFFDADPGSRDGDSSDPGNGIEKSRIRDKHPESAAPLLTLSRNTYLMIQSSLRWIHIYGLPDTLRGKPCPRMINSQKCQFL